MPLHYFSDLAYTTQRNMQVMLLDKNLGTQ